MVESKLDPTVGQTIQQMKKGVRSEIGSETWSSGRIEVSVVFCVLFVCVFFAVSRSCLEQMKVLEERLMYLFIVFCKELLCVSIPFWLKDFHLCVYIFRFPPLPHPCSRFSINIASKGRSRCFTQFLSYCCSEVCFIYKAFVLLVLYSALHFKAE